MTDNHIIHNKESDRYYTMADQSKVSINIITKSMQN